MNAPAPSPQAPTPIASVRNSELLSKLALSLNAHAVRGGIEPSDILLLQRALSEIAKDVQALEVDFDNLKVAVARVVAAKAAL